MQNSKIVSVRFNESEIQYLDELKEEKGVCTSWVLRKGLNLFRRLQEKLHEKKLGGSNERYNSIPTLKNALNRAMNGGKYDFLKQADYEGDFLTLIEDNLHGTELEQFAEDITLIIYWLFALVDERDMLLQDNKKEKQLCLSKKN